MKYNESEEMYLETLLLLKHKNSLVRSVDIANELGYSKASVSRAVKMLKTKGYILVNDGIINFTDSGMKCATKIYERHSIITDLLVTIGADVKTAEENACRIEHVISEEIVQIIRLYLSEKHN